MDVWLEGALAHLSPLVFDSLILELLEAQGLLDLAVVVNAEFGTADVAGYH